MCGRWRSNSAHNSRSGRRRSSEIDSSVRTMALCEVWPSNDVLDAVQDYRAASVEECLVVIGVKLARCKPAPSGEAAYRIRQPVGQMRNVLKHLSVAVVGRDR